MFNDELVPMRKCLKCGRLNSKDADRCICGYNLVYGTTVLVNSSGGIVGEEAPNAAGQVKYTNGAYNNTSYGTNMAYGGVNQGMAQGANGAYGGTAQQGMNQAYGTAQQGMNQAYGGAAQQSMNGAYGSVNRGTNAAYGGTTQQGMTGAYGNVRQGTNQAYGGTAQQGMNQAYGGAAQQGMNQAYGGVNRGANQAYGSAGRTAAGAYGGSVGRTAQTYSGAGYDINPFKAYINCLKKYADFKSRSPRIEYWSFFLINVVINYALQVAAAYFILSGGIGAVVSVVAAAAFSLFMLIPGISVAIRRAHDVGKSGWFMLIPVYNLILTFLPGDRGPNRYGNPRY